ncbi:hypothetical protein BAUCODRAFT_64122 [Baudoinia panamericana UAMH 10762]|uniref:Uncharacterized protein n=1 Tax=Baudoinia panamericana (strain UAMH 10762) TaxID=717646 RepID=M2LZF8_BAUPA|nr:uncharacterized protein BAUCODRAFT_64122 [Baudoinia panamericana UAMH 10762]EMD00068.1 hypothetical protein BAUCODRAFT_64122 [Baudoinia panamericana UAMH 10762]
MESPTDWTATAPFSPSKAKAQQAQARDWASVDSWLVKVYGRRVPSVERNEETLQVLLSLATRNETADDQHAAIDLVEKAALRSLKRQDDLGDRVIETAMCSFGLAGHDGVQALAETATLLGATNTLDMAAKLCDLSTLHFDLEQQVERAGAQRDTLTKECNRAMLALQELQSNQFQHPVIVHEQIAEWSRSARQLKAKLVEYDERLSALHANIAGESLCVELMKQNFDLEELRQRLNMINTDISPFQHLPSDGTLARKELSGLKNELQTLLLRRNDLFEQLVD